MPLFDPDPAVDYPEDWEEQGWCCRDCAVIAWYGDSAELRRMYTGQDNDDD